jgi:hypothetical protein
MRRIVSVLTVMAIMAAMLAVMAAPAFAEAKSPVANCVGVLASHAEPGTKGQVVSEGAKSDKKGAVGELVKSLAREAPPRGDERPCSLG